jgi:hypothetical protein
MYRYHTASAPSCKIVVATVGRVAVLIGRGMINNIAAGNMTV